MEEKRPNEMEMAKKKTS